MNKLTLLLFLLISSISCNSSNNNDNNNTAENTEADSTEVVTLSEENVAAPDESEMIRTSSFEMQGTIDGKHAITMHISYDYGKFREGKDKELPVTGYYSYNKSSSGFELEGKIDVPEQTIELIYKKNGDKNEVFSGKITGKFDSLNGNWNKVIKEKNLNFLLTRKSTDLSPDIQEAFRQKLNEIIKRSAGKGQLPFDTLGIDNKGLYLHHKDYWVPEGILADNSYQVKAMKEVTDKGWVFTLNVQVLLFEDSNDFLISEESSYSSYRINDEGESPVKDEKNIFIWKLVAKDFKNILTANETGFLASTKEEIVKHRKVKKTVVKEASNNKTWELDEKKKLLILKK
jgi:hypothetical protein